MVKNTISAALRKAAKEALKAVSAAQQGKPKHSPAQPRLAQNPRQKQGDIRKVKIAAPKQAVKKDGFLKIDPSALLKDFQQETKAKNKKQINPRQLSEQMAAKEKPLQKTSKEMLRKIKATKEKGAGKNKAKQKEFLPVTGYRIPSGFGEDRGDHRHSGIDLAVAEGAAVAAVKSGTVVFAGWSRGYGYRIVIDHGDGSETTYSHLSDIGVEKGEAVHAGSQIGLSGNTGRSTGPHLHFEVKVDGEYRNPESYFDFGNGFAAKSDTTYESKLSASAKSSKKSSVSSKKQAAVFAAPPSLTLPTAKDRVKEIAVFSPPNPLPQHLSARRFNDKERDQNLRAMSETNPLMLLVPAYQKRGNTKRTKRTAVTKRKT